MPCGFAMGVLVGSVKVGAYDEWGNFSIDELMALRWNGIPRIEIDRYFCKTSSSMITES